MAGQKGATIAVRAKTTVWLSERRRDDECLNLAQCRTGPGLYSFAYPGDEAFALSLA